MQELLSPAPTRSYVLLLLALNRHFAAFYIGSQTREFYIGSHTGINGIESCHRARFCLSGQWCRD